ncbi:transcriptional regulator, TetR family [Aliiroseovarius halocynthiae]|uniref:TetR/AcrR family transcriptional regulator n=1 Tax=Aliiroseovarius halocynthiae TaxID=985055 RepID=A0A545SQY9_9RHOB|nr:TetR/AcrR family transcriptional regulator [Aliiroseovarius halocynthiae]TQV67379.1 TetR/AcrR family transcriptional regulator [Aliiroseovarius halocynthiae]SMR81308.1 transcriptional regulator, TetR family [Aliiroseovarius halocynthiae]
MVKKSGKASKLTREAILSAAVKLADEAGADSLSMRKLASALGVEAMSLYNHFSNKDALLMGMVDWAVGQIPLPNPDGPWQDELRARAHNARAVFRRHPWTIQLMLSLPNMGSNGLTYVEATLAVMTNAGFALIDADHAWNLMDSHIYGFTLQELNFPFAPEEYAEVTQAHLHLIPAETYPNLRAMAEKVAAREYDGLHNFEQGVELIIAGLEGGQDQ